MRFHSLPESEQYAQSPADYREILRRHLALIAELCDLTSTSVEHLLTVTQAFSETSAPTERDRSLRRRAPASVYWKSLIAPWSDAEDPFWAHIYVGATTLGSPELRSLLFMVADEQTNEVIICPPGAEWLYHPYDGGGDVVAPDEATRDLLRAAHPDWLPKHGSL